MRLWALVCVPVALSGVGCGGCRSLPAMPKTYTPALAVRSLIPKPEMLTAGDGTFELSANTALYVPAAEPEVADIARLLAERLSAATGWSVRVLTASGTPAAGGIHFTLGGAATLGEEGYALTVTRDRVSLGAAKPAGLYRGVQTIRQLLPPAIESATPQPGPWRMPCVTITDRPRFAWRGAMLDVARHFFGVADVKHFIDLAAYYKMNRLHLHLSDDQGWRLAIDAWPTLTTVGGATQVGGGTGAFFYTKADYTEIVAYAAARHITVVPEIDLPGHTNAVLTSSAELNCDGVARPPYTGIEVGFSSLCLRHPKTLSFVNDVVAEIAALTPGPYFHIGGDEARSTDAVEYVRFIEEVQAIVASHGKRTVGWEEIATVRLLPTSLVQHWDQGIDQRAIEQGAKVILSPAKKAYLDMKYDASTALGQDWAGRIDVRDDARRYRIHDAAAPGRSGRDRLVSARGPRLGRVSRPTRDPRPALEGNGRELLPLASGNVDVTPRAFPPGPTQLSLSQVRSRS
jgi:hexosaminidase